MFTIVVDSTEVLSSSVYCQSPPTYGFLSNPVTSKPSSARFLTATRPAGPAPMTATVGRLIAMSYERRWMLGNARKSSIPHSSEFIRIALSMRDLRCTILSIMMNVGRRTRCLESEYPVISRSAHVNGKLHHKRGRVLVRPPSLKVTKAVTILENERFTKMDWAVVLTSKQAVVLPRTCLRCKCVSPTQHNLESTDCACNVKRINGGRM
jgi:hypothetical protein